jgi:MraZ protein
MTTVQDNANGGSGELAGVDGFLGFFTHTLDSKRRLTIPAGWREMVGVPRRLYILPGINVKCLYVYPAREMLPRLEILRKLSIADVKGQQFLRTLAFQSELLGWDTQGRIRVKDELLAYAGIEDQAMLVGSFNKVELWKPERWNEQQATTDPSTFGEEMARYIGL